jgi:TFIIF-interacting CTD phosphatase-like protein
MKYFESNAHFVIFSDDIQYCKNNFSNIKNVSFIEDKDYIELLLMSKMDGAIIANSTFSWWGAWLNSNPNKIVIAPKKWFGDRCDLNESDIIPSNWIRL